MDYIYLEDCRFYGYHGAFVEEQTLGQIFTVNCILALDLSNASESDCLEDTVHYGLVFDCIKKHLETERYRLLEKLAGVVISSIFSEFQMVQEITLKITKENPPINGHYKSVGVELHRKRT